MEKHFLYVLLKNEKPIYFGVTNNPKKRKNSHKSKALIDFDKMVVLDQFEQRETALAAERSIIRVLHLFNLCKIDNALEQKTKSYWYKTIFMPKQEIHHF